jgi:hypothetical protein
MPVLPDIHRVSKTELPPKYVLREHDATFSGKYPAKATNLRPITPHAVPILDIRVLAMAM